MNIQVSKYRKLQKPRLSACVLEQKRIFPNYGSFAIKSLSPGRVTFAELNSLKKTIKKVIKKNGFIWQVLFADQPTTSKPAEVRMGKGKGNFSHNIALVGEGTIIFELGGELLSSKLAYQAFLQASSKASLPLKFIFRLA